MPRSNPCENLVRRDARAGNVLPDRLGEKAVETGAFRRIEVVVVVRRNELDLRALRERARFIQNQPASLHPRTQPVRHSRRIARSAAQQCCGCVQRQAARWMEGKGDESWRLALTAS